MRDNIVLKVSVGNFKLEIGGSLGTYFHDQYLSKVDILNRILKLMK